MNRAQKIILALAVVSYIFVLYCFLTQNYLVLLISVIASSALLICFNLASSNTVDVLEESDFKIEGQISENAEIVALKEEAEKLKRELSEKSKSLEDAESEIAKEKSEKENAIKDKQKEIDDAVALALANADVSVDDSKFQGIQALIPNSSNEDSDTILNICSLVKETAEEFTEFAKKAEVTIRVNCSNEALTLEADPSKIRILLRNIIDNSIKYMKRAGSLVITVSSVDKDVFVVLKDNGQGLPADETEHVFELNFQGSNRISGNGLGLTQAKAIVDYYGGSISARSEAGSGMGIYIQIPMEKGESI